MDDITVALLAGIAIGICLGGWITASIAFYLDRP